MDRSEEDKILRDMILSSCSTVDFESDWPLILDLDGRVIESNFSPDMLEKYEKSVDHLRCGSCGEIVYMFEKPDHVFICKKTLLSEKDRVL